jgi:hypothetical protein
MISVDEKCACGSIGALSAENFKTQYPNYTPIDVTTHEDKERVYIPGALIDKINVMSLVNPFNKYVKCSSCGQLLKDGKCISCGAPQ